MGLAPMRLRSSLRNSLYLGTSYPLTRAAGMVGLPVGSLKVLVAMAQTTRAVAKSPGMFSQTSLVVNFLNFAKF